MASYYTAFKKGHTSSRMFHHFKFFPFLIGLLVGIGIFFFAKPEANGDRVVKWPHPSNAGKVTYRDRNGLCYTYEAQIADCAQVKESLQTIAFE
jgi:hypothetical protein